MARHSMGYCPQDSVLFERLTVREHIWLYMRIKGMEASDEEIKCCAQEVGLDDLYRMQAGSLSPGNQRKLSLAIAFCGDSELLVLDVPTSRMGELQRDVCTLLVFALPQHAYCTLLLDPASRRSFWDCLRRKRIGRSILLVSHDIKEANVCSDR